MNLEELYELTIWVEDNISAPELPSKYQHLYDVIHRSTQPNQRQQPFENEKNILLETLDNININELNNEQINFLKDAELFDLIAQKGREFIEDILYINALDLATVAEKINERITLLNNALERFEHIKEGLSNIVDISETQTEDVLLKVHFAGDAGIENVVDFKKWASSWYDISRGIAMLEGTAPESVKVVGARKGTIIIELAVVAGIATTISGVLLSILKVADKVLDIRKKAEEIKSLKLSNKKIAGELIKEAEKEKETGVKSITESLIDQSKSKTDGELKNILELAIKKLVEFIEKGGEVDCSVPPESEEQNDSEQKLLVQVRDNFKKIRELESKIKLLESHTE